VGIYLLLFLCIDAGINTVIISIMMYILIVLLAHDLTDVYLESQNEWLVEENEEDEDSQKMVKAEAERKRSTLYKEN
jgi:hypothetical protein